jgi:hypothetical protein
MEKLFRQILYPIINFFNRIIDKETERVNEFNGQFLGGEPDITPDRIGSAGVPLVRKEVKDRNEFYVNHTP